LPQVKRVAQEAYINHRRGVEQATGNAFGTKDCAVNAEGDEQVEGGVSEYVGEARMHGESADRHDGERKQVRQRGKQQSGIGTIAEQPLVEESQQAAGGKSVAGGFEGVIDVECVPVWRKSVDREANQRSGSEAGPGSAASACHAEQNEDSGPEQIELFLDRKRPEVLDGVRVIVKGVICRVRQCRNQIADTDRGAREENSQEDVARRKNPEGTPDIKGAQAHAAGGELLLNHQAGDEVSRDNEEDANSEIAEVADPGLDQSVPRERACVE